MRERPPVGPYMMSGEEQVFWECRFHALALQLTIVPCNFSLPCFDTFNFQVYMLWGGNGWIGSLLTQ